MLIQIAGLCALVVLMGLGYWRWVRPHRAGVVGQGLLLLIVATLVGGLLGSTGWWFDEPRSFAWNLPPLASRMLAAAGWAFGVATLAALLRPTRHRVRLVLLLLTTYLTPLLVAIPLFHLDRFDSRAPITYAFFAIVLALILPALWYLLRQPTIVLDPPVLTDLPAPFSSVWLGIVAAIAVLWGVALFITDAGPWRTIWAWPGDLLTSRLIAVMLLTIAVGSVYSLRHADASRVMLGVVTVYGFGVTFANLANILADKPVNATYVAAFGALGIGSVLALAITAWGGARNPLR